MIMIRCGNLIFLTILKEFLSWEIFYSPEYKGYETHSHHQEVQQVEATSTEASSMEDEPVGNNFEQAFNGEDCSKEVVKVVENLWNDSWSFFELVGIFLTLFLSEFELRGSSAASIALETMMHKSTTLPKYGWLHSQWQWIRILDTVY